MYQFCFNCGEQGAGSGAGKGSRKA